MKKKEQIEIYVVKDSETDNMYWRMKGFRSDLYVKYNNKYYKMYAIEFTVFKDDLSDNYESLQLYLYYVILIVVGD